MIFTYIAIFRLDELGFPTYKQMVLSQEPVKMHVFLSYLFDEQMLTQWVKEEWCKVLDIGYIENNIFDRIRRFKPEIDALLAQLHAKAYASSSNQSEGQDDAAAKKKNFTVPKPFNLHKPRKAKLPQPMRIPQKSFARDPPKTLQNTSYAQIQEERAKKREETLAATRKKYSNEKQFNFTENRANIEELRKQVDEERYAELHNKFKARPAPKFKDSALPVRLNAGTLLKEDALYRKKQQQEAALIQVRAKC